ncbi:MAG: ABC transporter ATP-binding protein [Spirochaetales bacterium]|nr:ABC transporter ATP-binding protein [Spirochaetales bacterium]MCF7938184.1 ABC transporter ATP-binding protein [Spirochaetales bacterium]
MGTHRSSDEGPILDVRDLTTYFNTDEGIVKAVDGVSFSLYRGETIAIVGESGSGKSVTNLSIMRLIPSPPGRIMKGQVLFEGRDLLNLPPGQMRRIRGNRISMIFQDPMTSLNPFLRISVQLIETLRLHQGLNRHEARKKAARMLGEVGIPSPERRLDEFPHQFSGGMRQRVMIAMALSCNPDILIADEPTTALDVTIQAQILELIQELTKRIDTAVVMITHDLGVVAAMSDRVNVMYAGRIVETGGSEDIFYRSRHPYTSGLIRSVPRVDRSRSGPLYSIPGRPPNLIELPDLCPFHPRCEQAMEICRHRYPPAYSVGGSGSVRVNCWLYRETGAGAEK